MSVLAVETSKTRGDLLRPVLVVAVLVCLGAIWMLPPLYMVAAVFLLATVGLAVASPLAGLCLLAFSVPWASGFSLAGGSLPLTVTDLLVAALGFAWLATGRSRLQLKQLIWWPYIVLFIAAIAASATQAADWHASAREIVKWLELLVVYVVAATSLLTKRSLRVVVAALVLASVSQALLGFVQTAFQLGPESFIHGVVLRAYGTFDQPNPYAGYLNLVLPLAVMVSILSKSDGERILYRCASFLILAALLASESRGALIATVAALAVVLVAISTRLRLAALAGIFGLLGGGWLVTLGVLPVGPFGRVLNAIGLGDVSFGHVTTANYSAVERAAHWLAGVRMFSVHPLLGVGIGNYAMDYPAYHPRGWYAPLAHAHNYYINVAAEAGVVGLCAYLLLVGSALWYSYASARRVQQAFCRAVVLGVLGALVATSFHSLFDVLYVHGMVALLGLLMGLVPVSLRVGSGAQDATAAEST